MTSLCIISLSFVHDVRMLWPPPRRYASRFHVAFFVLGSSAIIIIPQAITNYSITFPPESSGYAPDTIWSLCIKLNYFKLYNDRK